MTANELMICDLVLYKNKPITVWEIDEYYNRINTESDGYNAITCVDISDIKPISLTSEILEKIGFVEFIPHNWQIVIDNIMIELREPEHNMAIWLDWEEHNTGTYASYILPSPNCVHELQHALRLCGIDKEIEL